MREIKFRAWDKVKDKMVEHFAHVGHNGMMYTIYQEPHSEYDVMQYTGLKDKNGKEIYEGDILRWTDGDGTIGKIEWWEGDAMFTMSPIANGFNATQVEMYEIIGNIYENSELLK